MINLKWMKKNVTKMMAVFSIMAMMTVSLAGCGSKEPIMSTAGNNTEASDSSEDSTQSGDSAEGEEGKDKKDKDKKDKEEKVNPTYNDLENVTFSKPSGIYTEEFTLELSLTEDDGSEIYYTTDGSDPAISDTAILYVSGIQIADRSQDVNVVSAVDPDLFCTANSSYNKTEDIIECNYNTPSDEDVDKCTVIRAACKNSDGVFSATGSATYFYGLVEDHIPGIADSCDASGNSLAVISITVDYDDLFDYEKGIYVKGKAFDESFETFKKQNSRFQGDDTRKILANYSMRGRDWEREAHIDFFEMNAEGSELAFEQECGIRIQGNFSRSDLQKGFRVYARKDYEFGEGKFKYPIFGDELKDKDGETIDKFKTFVLRAGGNCALTCKYNDTYWQQLVSSVDCDTKASRPAVVYLNGEYWGVYVLEEDYSEEYFESHYGVDSDEVVIYKGDAETYSKGYKLDAGDIPEGEDEDYYFKDLIEFFDTHSDLTDDADYEEFAKLVDVQSVMDYFSVEVWINNKWDWPGKNWSMWRTAEVDEENEYADGRFRFSIYDVEFGGVSGSSDASTNTVKEDNYKTKGLLDMDTSNPAVLCFAYLMTNETFRTDYNAQLFEYSDTIFEKDHALEVLTTFEDTYSPLFDQFFDRYPGAGSTDNAINGGYASSKCIRDFLAKRDGNIAKMVTWINKQY